MGVDQTGALLQLLETSFPDGVIETSTPLGDATAVIRPEHLTRIVDFLKNDSRFLFNVLIDITAVDYPDRKLRFEIVYRFLSLSFNRRLCVKASVDGGDPVIDSLTPWWGSANWLEREVWDMFGVRFAGHPDLRRILMYDEFRGHPLRKDYPLRERQPRPIAPTESEP